MGSLNRKTAAAKWRAGLSDRETVEVGELQRTLREQLPAGVHWFACERLCRLTVLARHSCDHPWFDDWCEDLFVGLHTSGLFEQWRGLPRAKWRVWLTLRLYELEKPEHRLAEVRELLSLLHAGHAGNLPDHDPAGVGLRFLPAEASRKFRAGTLAELLVAHAGSALSGALWRAFVEVLERGDPDELIAGYGATCERVGRDRMEIIRNHDKAQKQVDPGGAAEEKENRSPGPGAAH
jgi:hypothetical protein